MWNFSEGNDRLSGHGRPRGTGEIYNINITVTPCHVVGDQLHHHHRYSSLYYTNTQNVVVRPRQGGLECRMYSSNLLSFHILNAIPQLFNRILAPYVENLDMNQVNYGIGQGRYITVNSLVCADLA